MNTVFKLNLNQSDKLSDIINPNNIENNVSWGKLSNISEAESSGTGQLRKKQ